jgi:MFS family permease
VYHPKTYVLVVAFRLLMGAVLVLSAYYLARKSDMPRRSAIVSFILLVLVTGLRPTPDTLGMVLILMGLFLHLHFPHNWRSNLLFAIAAALSLVKFSFFVMSLSVLIFAISIDIMKDRNFFSMVLTYVSFFAMGVVLMGMNAVQLSDYIAGGLILSNEYSAMALLGPTEHLVYFLLGAVSLLGVLFHLAHHRRSMSFLFTAMGTLIYVLISLKAGLIRHDIHVLTSSTMLLGAVIPALWVCFNSQWAARKKTVALSPLFFSVALLWVTVVYVQTHYAEKPIRTYVETRLGGGYFASDALLAPLKKDRQTKHENAIRLLKERFPLPAEKAGTFDIYPYQLGVLLAHDVAYTPRPVPQSYLAYSAQLVLKNLRHVQDPATRPDHILFDVSAIDTRLPALDDGASWYEIMTQYRVKDILPGFLHLMPVEKAEKPMPQFSQFQALDLNEALEIKNADQRMVWARIRTDKTFLGALLEFFYKVPPLEMSLELQDGTVKKYTLPGSAAERQVLLSPMITTQRQFALAATGKIAALNGQKVVRIVFKQSRLLYEKVHVAVQTTNAPEYKNPLNTALLSWLEQGKALQGGGVPVGVYGLKADTPSEYVFPAPPKDTLKVNYGVHPEAWAVGRTDGVRFEVIAKNGSAETVLLDTVLRQSDSKGPSAVAMLDIPRGTDQLVLKTHPAGTPNWDWAYWDFSDDL